MFKWWKLWRANENKRNWTGIGIEFGKAEKGAGWYQSAEKDNQILRDGQANLRRSSCLTCPSPTSSNPIFSLASSKLYI